MVLAFGRDSLPDPKKVWAALGNKRRGRPKKVMTATRLARSDGRASRNLRTWFPHGNRGEQAAPALARRPALGLEPRAAGLVTILVAGFRAFGFDGGCLHGASPVSFQVDTY